MPPAVFGMVGEIIRPSRRICGGKRVDCGYDDGAKCCG
jgi:hypothetical protein